MDGAEPSNGNVDAVSVVPVDSLVATAAESVTAGLAAESPLWTEPPAEIPVPATEQALAAAIPENVQSPAQHDIASDDSGNSGDILTPNDVAQKLNEIIGHTNSMFDRLANEISKSLNDSKMFTREIETYVLALSDRVKLIETGLAESGARLTDVTNHMYNINESHNKVDNKIAVLLKDVAGLNPKTKKLEAELKQKTNDIETPLLALSASFPHGGLEQMVGTSEEDLPDVLDIDPRAEKVIKPDAMLNLRMQNTLLNVALHDLEKNVEMQHRDLELSRELPRAGFQQYLPDGSWT